MGLSSPRGSCWTPAHLPGNLGPLRPRKEGERWHTVKRQRPVLLPPQQQSLQQRFGPHARGSQGRAGVPCGGSWPSAYAHGAGELGGVPHPALHRAAPGGHLSAGTGGGLLSALGRRGACRSVSAAHSGGGRGSQHSGSPATGADAAGWDPLPADGGPHRRSFYSWAAAPCLL